MIRINVKKEELENFINSLDKKSFKATYKNNNINIKNISFEYFKELFCNDEFNFLEEEENIIIYKILYNKISSSRNLFYSKIRDFIINKFTEDIKFCPYCGKNPLIYFDENNTNKRMFQFDHFFPKNVYHKGIINFYNLIPSCNACNHLKSDNNPLDIINKGGIIFHPYLGNLFLENRMLKNDLGRNSDIRLNYISENSKFLKLGHKYMNSEDTFNTFNFIQDKRSKIKEERIKFKNFPKDDDKIKDYFFKNYYPKSEQEILKYSNGKLKKDLIDNLEIKKETN